jgi:hypothetical protein
MNHGNGVRLADANQFMESVVKTADNKATISRTLLNHEFIAKEKDDGVNNVQVSKDRISANPFVEYSRLTARNGAIYEFVWENSDPSLLYPGMMVRVLYLLGNDIVEQHGVLLYTHALTQLRGTPVSSKAHITTSHLAIFVNKPNN